CDLFGRVDGAVTVIDENGESFTSTDLIQVGKFASNAKDPWIDLVTDKGEGIGLFVAGKAAAVVDPEPTIKLGDGMVYLFDGDPAPGMQQDKHLLPLGDLDAVIAEVGSIDDLLWYVPEDIDIETKASLTEVTLMTGRNRQERQ